MNIKVWILCYFAVSLALVITIAIFRAVKSKKEPNPITTQRFILLAVAFGIFWLPLLVLLAIMWFKYRKGPEPQIKTRNDQGDPLIVLYSHPETPGALPRKYEGRWLACRGIVPDTAVQDILDGLKPACHADWSASVPASFEESYGYRAVVIYVRPGERTKEDSCLILPLPGTSPFEQVSSRV